MNELDFENTKLWFIKKFVFPSLSALFHSLWALDGKLSRLNPTLSHIYTIPYEIAPIRMYVVTKSVLVLWIFFDFIRKCTFLCILYLVELHRTLKVLAAMVFEIIR